jgi:hypothetical protein
MIVLVGVGLAAIRESSEFWDAAIFTLTIFVLLSAILIAIHRRRDSRAFWLGFALWGSCYLSLSIFPPSSERLLTTRLLSLLDAQVTRQTTASYVIVGEPWDSKNSAGLTFTPTTSTITISSNPGGTTASTGSVVSSATRAWGGTTEHFMNIGHALTALLIGTCGGTASRAIHSRSAGAGEVADAATVRP